MLVTTWLTFAAASIVLLLIPGPTVLLVVSYALSHGRRSRGVTVAGVALGNLIAMSICMLGGGALLAASADIFSVVRWIGAAYLVYLGIMLWRTPVVVADAEKVRPGRMMLHAFTVTALNPKNIVFFVVFVPQFLDAAQPLPPQMSTLEASFVSLSAIMAFGWAMVATGARRFIRRASVQRTVNRMGGGFLMGLGVLAVTVERA